MSISDQVLDIFRETGALLQGHFILTSGRHSATYFQCAKVLQHPEHLQRFANEIADHFQDQGVDLVISPAVGGIVLGSEVGRQLNIQTIFAEREQGVMTLRRGFEIQTGNNVLVVEDVVTTGGSVQDVMNVVTKAGANIVGVSVLVDRSGGVLLNHPESNNSSAALQGLYPGQCRGGNLWQKYALIVVR